MKFRKITAGLALAALPLLGLTTACGEDTAEPAEVEEIEYPDCDLEDQRNREPDCGRYVNGRWVWWKWVKPGTVSKPAKGWTPVQDGAPINSVPRVTRKPQTGGSNVKPANPPRVKPANPPARRPR